MLNADRKSIFTKENLISDLRVRVVKVTARGGVSSLYGLQIISF